jgi:hypothetical protein
MNLEDDEDIKDNVFIGSSATTKRYLKLIEIAFDTGNVPVLWGPPGVGKTQLIMAIAKDRKYLMRVLIGSTMDPTDVAGLPVLRQLPSGETITEFTMPDWFHEVSEYARAHPESGATVLIDEITTSSPPVQAALLTFIQDRRIGKFYLPDNVFIIAAGNPPSQAADGWQLAPPTANRLTHIELKPSIPDWFAGMRVAWNKPDVSDAELAMRARVVAFLTLNRNLINSIPDDPDEAAAAWPSMRSWDNAARMLGRVEDLTMAEMAVKATVGKKAGGEFILWLDSENQIPAYESVMANPEAVAWNDLRADQLFLMMSTVVDNVTADNFEQSYRVFRASKKARADDVVNSLLIAFKKASFNAYTEAGFDPAPLRSRFVELAKLILGNLARNR